MARTKGSDGTKTAERILKEALRMFARQGYGAVSMRMIADAVGVNAGAIYNHFPTKQDILLRLMSDHMVALLAAWNEQPVAGLRPAEKLERFVRFHIAENLPRADAVFISFMELRALEPLNHSKIEAMRRDYESIAQTIIKEGCDDGQFHVEDAHVATMSVLGSLIGVNTWYRAKGRLSKDKIQDYYTAMILRMVGCEMAEV